MPTPVPAVAERTPSVKSLAADPPPIHDAGHELPTNMAPDVHSIAEVWEPTEKLEQMSVAESAPPILDEVEPNSAEDGPTVAVETLADSFASWRTDPDWQPPQLPRFGPPRSPSGSSYGPDYRSERSVQE